MSCINPNYDFQNQMGEIRKTDQPLPKPLRAEQDAPTICRDVFTPDASPQPEFSRKDMIKWMGTGGL